MSDRQQLLLKAPHNGASAGDSVFAQEERPRKKSTKNEAFWVFVVNLFVPSILFSTFFSLMGSQQRFHYPYLVLTVLVALEILFFCAAWSAWFFSGRAKLLSTALLCTVALICAPLAADVNYTYTLYPYYVSSSLQDRVNVSPQVSGDSVKDSGRVYFAHGTRVETKHGMSYVSADTYCVAPITMEGKSLARYDFWAIGVNCCNSDDPDFKNCGEVSNPYARAGLRLVYPEQNQYFRLAVQQAEAEYDIEASESPLFFYWVQDPERESEKFLRYGLETVALGNILYFMGINLPLTLVLGCVF